MTQEDDERLMSDTEWAALMAAAYESEGSPVDELGKKRVWQRLKRRMELQRRTRRFERIGIALVSGVIAVIGGTKFLKQSESSREKGHATSIPINLTPYALDRDGATSPLDPDAPPGVTIVFRAFAPRLGPYAVVLVEGHSPPQIAIDEGGTLGPDDRFLTKQGKIYGLQKMRDKFYRICVVAAADPGELADLMGDLNKTLDSLPEENCLAIESAKP